MRELCSNTYEYPLSYDSIHAFYVTVVLSIKYFYNYLLAS